MHGLRPPVCGPEGPWVFIIARRHRKPRGAGCVDLVADTDGRVAVGPGAPGRVPDTGRLHARGDHRVPRADRASHPEAHASEPRPRTVVVGQIALDPPRL